MKTHALLLVLALAATAAGDKTDPEPARKDKAPPKADIRGQVTSVTAPDARAWSMSVDGKKEKDTEYDRARVRLNAKTKIYKWVDGKKKEAKPADLVKGSLVQVNFVGPVAESYPVQATAGEVLILPAAKKVKKD